MVLSYSVSLLQHSINSVERKGERQEYLRKRDVTVFQHLIFQRRQTANVQIRDNIDKNVVLIKNV